MRLMFIFAACGLLFLATSVFGETAGEIYNVSGVEGGLVVHVGCGDASLTASLRKDDCFLVQGLDASAERVCQSREAIHSKGLYGKVTAALFDGKSLPYADNLVNLIVITDSECQVSEAEIQRVLAPRGVALVSEKCKRLATDFAGQTAGDWLVCRKPVPADIDDWPHFLHGADNNAVAKDSKVGPPRRLQWSADPLWARSHQFISSLVAMVSGGGRLFYVYDEAPVECADKSLPERWTLIARDAMNGVLLWKVPLPHWRGEEWTGTSMRGRPPSTPRRIVIGDQYLYVTPSHQAGISILDPATGKTAKTIEGSEGAQEIVLNEEILVSRLAKTDSNVAASTAAFDAATGRELWRREERGFQTQSLAASRGRVAYHNGVDLVCLSQQDGKELWRNGPSENTKEDKAPSVDRRGKKTRRRKASNKVQ